MSAAPLPGQLPAEEARLHEALLGLPDGPLRERVLRLVSELAELAAHPSCPELQADGVPCATVQTACEECRRVDATLDALHSRLHEG